MLNARDENGILLVVIVILAGLLYGVYRILRGPRE